MQTELNEFKDTVWNTHRIRAQKDTLMADGVPNHIYEFPDRYGMEKKGILNSCVIYTSLLLCAAFFNSAEFINLNFRIPCISRRSGASCKVIWGFRCS
jgi:hypothetical protein